MNTNTMATQPQPKNPYTMDQIIGQIDSGHTWPQLVITYNADGLARTGPSNTASLGIQPMTPQEKQMANYAFSYWDDLIAPTLQPTPGYPDANISFNYTTTLPVGFGGQTTGDARYLGDAISAGGGVDVWIANS